jgi:hypothetical protein
MKLSHTCAAPSCARLAWRNRSRYCSTHMIRVHRYGTPSAQPVAPDQIEQHETYLDRGLTLYANTKGVNAALKLADEVLNYRAPAGFAAYTQIDNQMRRLRDHEVTPRDILLRVAAVYAYARVRTFGDDRAFNAALARAVLRLAPLRGYRPLCRVLQWLADEITQRLTLFANAFVARLESDAEREREERRASTDFDTPAAQP